MKRVDKVRQSCLHIQSFASAGLQATEMSSNLFPIVSLTSLLKPIEAKVLTHSYGVFSHVYPQLYCKWGSIVNDPNGC